MRILQNCIKSDGGNMSLMFGGILFLIIAGAAGASDMVLWQSQQTKLQDAADTAALAGAIKLGKGGNKIEKSTKDQAYAFAKDANDTTLPGFTSNVIIDTAAETVDVELSVEVPRMFSSLFITENPTVHARATAKVVYGDKACIYVLNPTGNDAVKTTGNAVLIANSCNIQINSTSAAALTNAGNATIMADNICVVGGYTGLGYTPVPQTGCAPVADPFASLVVPAAGICDFTNTTINASQALTPGTYCGGIRVSGSGTVVTLSAGTYILKDGPLKVSSSGSVVGSEVVFVLDNKASIDISGIGQVTTTPPLSGPLEGYSVVQSPTMPLGEVSKITGEGQFDFPGIIYMPVGDLDLGGKAAANTFTPTYAAVVVYNLKLSGSGDLNITADNSAFSQQASQTLTTSSARLIH